MVIPAGYVAKPNSGFPTIALIDKTSDPHLLTPIDLGRGMKALQRFVDEQFAPHWFLGANFVFIAKGDTPPPGSWWLVICEDNGVYAGGYHDITPDYTPIMYVELKNTSTYTAYDWRTFWVKAASHEVAETLVDPYISVYALHQRPDSSYVLVLTEVCDPVNDFNYNTMVVEDTDYVLTEFALPSWYKDGSVGPWDLNNRCNGPFIVPLSFTGGEGTISITVNGPLTYQRQPARVVPFEGIAYANA